jgi:hypothetical protein
LLSQREHKNLARGLPKWDEREEEERSSIWKTALSAFNFVKGAGYRHASLLSGASGKFSDGVEEERIGRKERQGSKRIPL